MLDDAAFELADRLFLDTKRRRVEQIKTKIGARVDNAASRGVLGAGFFHQAIVDDYTDELRHRADSVVQIVRQVATSSGPIDAAMSQRLTGFVEQHIRREASDLTESASKDVARFQGIHTLVASITDKVTGVVDGARAEIELFILQENQRSHPAANAGDDDETESAVLPDPRRVFVVLGRDDRLVKDLFSFLESVGLQPIPWRDAVALTGQGSPYIGDVLDRAFATAQAVVVLLSPDDEVRLSQQLLRGDDEAAEREFRLQPRPNVMFEAGMAFAHAADRTIMIEVGSPKRFSDVAGRHVVRLTNDVERRKDLLDRLKTAGCSIDTSSDKWKATGNFDVDRLATGSQHAVASASEPKVKWVDMNYPTDSGMQKRLEDEGYRLVWSDETHLQRRLDIQGWTLATIVDGKGNEFILRMKDRPEDQTLIKKKRSDG